MTKWKFKTNTGESCLLVFVIFLLLIPIILMIVLNCSSPRERFSSEAVIPLDERWKNRWDSLNSIIPIFYRSYFKGVESVNRIKPETKKGKIFVSIASYRDNQCLDTVRNITENAESPEDLVIVICQQNSLLEKDCLGWCKSPHICSKSKSKIERLSHKDARGPTWARWRIQEKWDGEEYYLQIDAHTRMVKNWDKILKGQLAMCPSEKPVLTNYPSEYEVVDGGGGDSEKEKWGLHNIKSGLYVEKLNPKDGFSRIQSNYTENRTSRPYQSTCWAAGFSFSKGDFFWEVGYDPYTPFLFFGEEMDIAIRGWTWGWDFYSPTETVIFHNYKRDHRSTFWENPLQKPLEILSRFRLYVRLGYIDEKEIPEKYRFILKDIDRYPLGRVRSIKDYEKFARIDIGSEVTSTS